MRRVSRLTVAFFTLGLSTLGPGTFSAAPQQPIRVGTNFVRVDAYPMKDGHIVTGLKAEDFEVLEDGVVQKIEAFEQVAISRGAYTSRIEPNTAGEMNRALGNPRSRVFLLFLDGPNVNWENATFMREPLQKFLRDYLGDDDLVGVMTPGMSASEVTYGRRTEVIANGLRGTWTWGRRNRDDPQYDSQLIQYGMCYPGTDVGAKMVARVRERNTLEALQSAVKHLHGVREERKAIVTVTEGWPLYREDQDLLRKRDREPPIGVDPIKAGPNGKLTADDPRNRINMPPASECDRARAYLATIDDERYLREIIDDANRGNASFYMIDPGGLRSSHPGDHSQAMRTLADNTDGYALLNVNDLERGFKRMADDMSSYYLLGYYASNSRPDGRFRNITVRVKQPGVAVRARKGYRAPTAEEVSTAVRKAEPPAVADAATPVRAAIDTLQRIRPNARFHLNAVVNGGPVRKIWVAGEVQSTGARPDEFMQGAKATVEVLGTGSTLTETVTLKSGERTFLAKFDVPSSAAGTLDVRARLVSDDGVAEPLADLVRVDLGSALPRALLFRRGVTTGNRIVPAADPRISRTDRIRLEIPVGPGPRDAASPSGRVLDRNGGATAVPVTVGERNDETTGQRWMTADITLGPLSPADYAIEVIFTREGRTEQLLTPVRVIR
jgi:VWFA-related protein